MEFIMYLIRWTADKKLVSVLLAFKLTSMAWVLSLLLRIHQKLFYIFPVDGQLT